MVLGSGLRVGLGTRITGGVRVRVRFRVRVRDILYIWFVGSCMYMVG